MRWNQYRYKARRLRSLRLQELTHRLSLWIRRRKNRRKYRLDPDSATVQRVYECRDLWLNNLESGSDPARAVNKALEESLPTGWWADDGFWDVFKRRYPEETDRLIADARAVLSGDITLFQWKKVHFPRPFRWSSTLQSSSAGEAEWPQTFYTDINVHHDPARPERDVKWCWELNRFQHLLCLGAAWRLTSDERFAREAREQVESWIHSIRYPLGVQWASNLEVAIRSLSWARCHILCANSASWDADFVARFTASLYMHLSHLNQELTVHHPPGNHLLGEASALLYLSTLYPLFVRSSQWRSRSLDILNRLVSCLILPDGVYSEQSTGYFRFVCEFLLPVLALPQRHGAAPSTNVRERLAKGLKWVKELAPSATEVPMMGDSDTGLAIGWRLSDFWDFTPFLTGGAVLLDLPALVSGMAHFPAEAFLMTGPDGLNTFAGFASDPTAHGGDAPGIGRLVSFPEGGYDVSSDSRFHIVFDAGPLGLSPGFGHGHEDGLSWVMYVNGAMAITDPGTHHYNAGRQWREYFRSVGAHSNLQIDGMRPSIPLDTFRWSRDMEIARRDPVAIPGAHVLGGTMRWGQIVQRRVLVHVLDEGLLVSDHVQGTGEHDVEFRLQFDPRWSLRRQDTGGFLVTNGSISLNFTLVGAGLDITLLRASESPCAGWYSRYYGHREATTTLLGRSRCRLPAAFLLLVTRPGRGLSLPQALPSRSFQREVLELFQSLPFHLFAGGIRKSPGITEG
jgi:hypothetical protein